MTTNNDDATNTMLTIKDFRAVLDSDFHLEYDDIQEKLKLVEVSPLNTDTVTDGQTEPFSLLFKSESTTVKEQGAYPLKHNTLNDMHVFLVPISADETSVSYEAIFT